MKARVALLGVALASGLAACGTSIPGNSPTSSFISGVPDSAKETATFSTTSTTAVTFPPINNAINLALTLPKASATTTASLVYSTGLPTGATAPTTDAMRRATSGSSGIDVLGVLSLSVPVTISVTQTPAFTFTFAAAPSSSVYIVYEDQTNPGAGWAPLLGPGVATGATVAFAAQSLVPPLTFNANDTYLFALVEATGGQTPPPTAYTGTKTVNYTYGFAFGYPTPAPGATAPPTTLSYNVTDQIAVGTSPLPTVSPAIGSAPSSLIDEHVSETDASSLASTTFTTDNWAALSSANGSQVVSIYGTQAQEPSSSTLPVYTTIYGTPQIADEYPETNGASWTNVPTATENYSFADGDSGVRTTASNGSYTDTEQILGQYGGQPAILTENSDGSGTITGPYFGGGIVDSLAFSAPSAGQITFTENFTAFAQSNYGFPASESIQDPVWFTAPLAPPTFYTETDTVATGVTLPAACGTTFGASATHVQRSVSTLDTIIGFEETTVFDSYDIGGVPVCLNTKDTLNYAYDTQGNTPYLIDLGELGLEVITTNETLTLSGAGSAGLPGTPVTAGAKRAAATSALSFSPALAALEHHQLVALAQSRAALIHNIVRSVRARMATNVKLQGGLK